MLVKRYIHDLTVFPPYSVRLLSDIIEDLTVFPYNSDIFSFGSVTRSDLIISANKHVHRSCELL